MLDFPGYQQRVDDIQSRHSAAIELATRMFSSWINRPIDRWLHKSDLAGEVLGLTFMLNVQACRQFRSVVELCRIGEAENAAILARSLFETVLASHFILAPKFYIVVEQKRGKPPRRDLLPGKWYARVRRTGEPCQTLSRKKRALLYIAHCLSQGVNVASAISDRHLATTGEQLQPPLDLRQRSTAQKAIGPKWRYIQSVHPHTYSGLSIKVLADVAGLWFPHWYEIMYPDQSRQVHAVDPASYVTTNPASMEVRAKWFSTDGTIDSTLYCANMLFFCFTGHMNAHIDMGAATEMLLQGFMDELKVLYHYSPTAP